MAEMTESHKASSTLSTNALDVPFFFRGRRMWPLARKSSGPGEACGAVLAKGCSEKGSSTVYGIWAGRVGGVQTCPRKGWKTVVWHAPEQLRLSLAGSGSARVRWEPSGTVSGSFRNSEIAPRGAFGAPKSGVGALGATVSVACSISKQAVGFAEHT